jgi:hypothetical protein
MSPAGAGDGSSDRRSAPHFGDDVSTTPRDGLRQRADYTHRFNARTGRHGWLRLTPAYSVKVVEELISRFDRPLRIFDPFCGTATTALSAAYHGHEAVTTDINPFLVWFGQAKVGRYRPGEIAATENAARQAIEAVERQSVEPLPAPSIHNIDRWWSSPALLFVRRLRAAIDAVTEPDSAERSLLLVAFCRTLIALSNAAFDHQSMSFRDDGQQTMSLGFDMGEVFRGDLRFVLGGAAENPPGVGRVLHGDARDPAAVGGGFERVITSPPYANRMSYVRELRPYMYWLGFLTNGREAGELDWTAIGGTWGVATSRLTEWERGTDGFASERLDLALDRIAHHTNANGRLLAAYVAKYFDDMWTHFKGLRAVLAVGAEVHYVVGNSTFYGVLLPVERIYAEMLDRLRFEAIDCRPLRKRNSKKELIEFDVTARWGG